MSKINEDIFTAIDLIVGKRLEEISYDITKPYIIKEPLGNGEYKVSDGSTMFLAYSENEEYKMDDEVYVLIPNGDYNETKLITGKVKRNGEYDIPYNYTSPEKEIIPLQLIEPENKKATGLLANEKNENNEDILQEKIFEHTVDYLNYTRLLIKGKFKTELPSSITQGHYGLKIVLTSQQNNGDTTNQQTTLLLDNVNDMIGNIYNFSDYFEQSQIYDISTLNKITKMEVSLYQTGDFKYKKYNDDGTTTIEYLLYQEDGVNLPDNIFVKDVSITLGYDSSIIDGDYVELYTDNLMYEDNTPKKIKLRWIQKDNNGVYQEKSSPNTNENIYWYRYQIGATSDGGANWEKLDDNTDLLSIDIQPNIKKPNDKFKAKVDITTTNKDGTSNTIVSYETPVLTLEHTVVVADEAALEALTKFTIIADDSRNGNYLLYNPNGSLINSNESSIVRELQIKEKDGTIYSFDSFAGVVDKEGRSILNYKSNANKIIKVKWTNLPSNSMMNFNEIKTYDKNNKVIYHAPSFNIKSIYTLDKTENNISCEIEDKQIYQVGTEFRFGVAGTNGSEYTLVVTLDNNKNFLVLNQLEDEQVHEVAVNVEILDTEGKSVKFDKTQLQYKLNSEQGDIRFNNDSNSVYVLPGTQSITNTSGAILEVKAPASLGLVEYDLITKIPIGLASADVVSVVGATEVLYNASGFPEYYKGQYEITQGNNTDKLGFDLGNTESERYMEQFQEIEEQYINGQISQDEYENAIKNLEFELDIAAPALKAITINKTNENGDELKEVVGYRLVPLNLYLTNKKIYYIIYKKNNSIQWCSPILIQQNRYSSKTLNEWDGELQVDEKGNKVLAKMFAAGKKNNDNTFTGVVMGEDRSNTDNTIGLYGFKNGTKVFSFDENGNAFIGAPGEGRITFNGTDGIIQGGYNGNNSYKTTINLVDGSISAPNFTISADGNAWFSGSGSFDGIITADEGYIGNWEIASSGLIYRGKSTEGDKKTPTIQIIPQLNNSTNNVININDNFKVDGKGNATIKGDATITGNITATSGEIGGWNITEITNNDTTSRILESGNVGLCSGSLYPYKPTKESILSYVRIYAGTSSLNQKLTEGSSNWWSDPTFETQSGCDFLVDNLGRLKAKNAIIEGKITATSGQIGDWYIDKGLSTENDTGYLINAKNNFTVDTNGNVTIKGTIQEGSQIVKGFYISPDGGFSYQNGSVTNFLSPLGSFSFNFKNTSVWNKDNAFCAQWGNSNSFLINADGIEIETDDDLPIFLTTPKLYVDLYGMSKEFQSNGTGYWYLNFMPFMYELLTQLIGATQAYNLIQDYLVFKD